MPCAQSEGRYLVPRANPNRNTITNLSRNSPTTFPPPLPELHILFTATTTIIVSTMASKTLLPALRSARTLPTFTRRSSPLFLAQRSAFQTSSKLAILPPLPQTIKGTVNDAAIVPTPEYTHGSYHWTMER